MFSPATSTTFFLSALLVAALPCASRAQHGTPASPPPAHPPGVQIPGALPQNGQGGGGGIPGALPGAGDPATPNPSNEADPATNAPDPRMDELRTLVQGAGNLKELLVVLKSAQSDKKAFVEKIEFSKNDESLLDWRKSAFHVAWATKHGQDPRSETHVNESFAAWRDSFQPENLHQLMDRLAAEYPVRFHLSAVPSDKLPTLHFCPWEESGELYFTATDDEWKKALNVPDDKTPLNKRSNVQMEAYSDTRRRAEGHPRAMDELDGELEKLRRARLFGSYTAPAPPPEKPGGKGGRQESGVLIPGATGPAFPNHHEHVPPNDGSLSDMGRRARLMPDGSDALADDGGAGNSRVRESTLEAAPTQNDLNKGVSIGKMRMRAFQLRHASVEGQALTKTGNAATDLPAEVRIPGVAKTLVAIANKMYGAGSLKLVSSGGDANFEKALLLTEASRLLESATSADYYKPYAYSGYTGPTGTIDQLRRLDDDIRINESAQLREAASLRERANESRPIEFAGGEDQVTELLNRRGLRVSPTVEKLIPEGVLRVDPSDLIPQEATQATVFSRGQGLVGGESAAMHEAAPTQEKAPELRGAIIAERATNRIIICDLEERMPAYERIINELDVPPNLVEISATIMDINANSGVEWGVDWAGFGKEEITEAVGTASSLFDGGLPFGGIASPNGLKVLTTPAGTLGADKVFHPVGLNASTLITGTSGKLAARLQALATDGKAQVISRPVLLTVANTEALFYDNNSLLLPVPGEHNADLFKVNAPLALRIKPVVMHPKNPGEQQLILLEIEIQDDTVTGVPVDPAVATPVLPANKPTAFLSESTIYTRALVREGQSLLLGGRYRHAEQKQDGGIPLLSRIPLVGLAFKDRRNVNVKLQRLFLITPRLVKPTGPHPLGPLESLPLPEVSGAGVNDLVGDGKTSGKAVNP
ncbi:type II/III secretion system protein [Roseimicrobium gellanilyticum]|uniref:Type II/III secretion system protein n=1 Tax=Roseimicrobium gellanilyticum TaxID=748857 RepID=A0A366H691_9BACT|nr:secretin N-terminal domain-containing protein [Roseimicrobium gellanilyticum]RBP36927.1 type II/III secretion system protein [Roseimicrobium gellanilyticum]